MLPIAFMILLGIFWFGRAYNIYGTITHAAREGVRTAVSPTCADCGNTIVSADQVADVVAQALMASKLDPNQVSPVTPAFCQCGNPNCGGSTVACSAVTSGKPQVCVQFNVQLDGPVSGPPTCGTAVSFQYPYQFYFPFTSLNFQLIQIRAQAEMKGEN